MMADVRTTVRRGIAAAGTALLLSLGRTVEAAFIDNAGFENVPGTMSGQGLLPTGWQQVTVTPDTYSNDGSYGLFPGSFGNFPGLTAIDGIRWVAGAAFGRMANSTTVGSQSESFGTTLVRALSPGEEYVVQACLHQNISENRPDLDNPGAYHLFLASGNTPEGVTGAAFLGALAPTTGVGAWEARALTFTAPADAGSRPFLIFAPYQVSVGGSYPGIDAVSLTAETATGTQTCIAATPTATVTPTSTATATPTATVTPTPVQTPAAPGSSSFLWLLSCGCIALMALARRIGGR